MDTGAYEIFVRAPIAGNEDILLTIFLNGVLQCSFHRDCKGHIGQTLQRIATKFHQHPASIQLFTQDSLEVNLSTLNADGWKKGHSLLFMGSLLPLNVNIPTVISLQIPLNPVVGSPIFPLVKFEFVEMVATCKFIWYRAEINENILVTIGTDMIFTPTESDIGFSLALECTPYNSEGCYLMLY